MNKYYISKKSRQDGTFSVHKEDCPFLNESEQRIFLGRFDTCKDAIKTARIFFLKSDACYFCLKEFSKVSKMKMNDWRVPGSLKIVYSEN